MLTLPFEYVRPSDVQIVMEEADQQKGQSDTPAPNMLNHSVDHPVIELTIHQAEQIRKIMKATHDNCDE